MFLSYEQSRLFVGFVLDSNDNNKIVHAATVAGFFLDDFGVKVTERTADNYLHSHGFASHVVQSKSTGFKLNSDEMCRIAFEWITTVRRSGAFNVLKSKLCSIDFTFTGHRTESQASFSPVGEPQPRSDTSVSIYTNCIVTCLWADGVNRILQFSSLIILLSGMTVVQLQEEMHKWSGRSESMS